MDDSDSDSNNLNAATYYRKGHTHNPYMRIMGVSFCVKK